MGVILLRIPTDHLTRALTPGATGPLIRRGLRTTDGDQPGHIARGIAPGGTRQSGIHHDAHARHRQGTLRDGGGHHDAGTVGGGQRAVLLRRGETTVQGEHLQVGQPVQGGGDALDLPDTG